MEDHTQESITPNETRRESEANTAARPARTFGGLSATLLLSMMIVAGSIGGIFGIAGYALATAQAPAQPQVQDALPTAYAEAQPAPAVLPLQEAPVAAQPAPEVLSLPDAPAEAQPAPTALPSQEAATIVDVAKSASPAVVSIQTDSGLGSGFIYDSGGLILTNAHVVEDATSLLVALQDGRHFQAELLGSNAGFDLAVVKIEGENLPVAPLGSSGALQVGEQVVAIGNPYGLQHTVTSGVVSAVHRPVSEGPGSYHQPMVQTDAAIHPGNSGGPLINMSGAVIGINTLVAAPLGMFAQGLGFAIPIDTAKRIAPQLVQDGRVTNSGQPFLGLSLGSIRPPGSRFSDNSAQPDVDHGALIGEVVSGGPSDMAGLQSGDVIVSFGNNEVYTTNELLDRLVHYKPGDQVPAAVLRDGATVNVTITIGEAPAVL